MNPSYVNCSWEWQSSTLTSQSSEKSSLIAEDCLLTGQEQACFRITRLFVCFFCWLSSPCQKWPNTQENGCWLPHSDHIHSWNPFPDQTRPGMRNYWSSHFFCIVDTGSCFNLILFWATTFANSSLFFHPSAKHGFRRSCERWDVESHWAFDGSDHNDVQLYIRIDILLTRHLLKKNSSFGKTALWPKGERQ